MPGGAGHGDGVTRDRSGPELVSSSRALHRGGVRPTDVRGELRQRRWQRQGLAVVQHNGPLSRDQRRAVALVHGGPQAVLTAFTAAEVLGLDGWERTPTDILVPAGTRPRHGCPVPLTLHYTGSPALVVGRSRVELLPHALLRAAATFGSARPGCGLLAAAVQQRLTDPAALSAALDHFTRVRHRRLLRAAVADIAGGSEALSEIDFVRLCRRYSLPEPERQAVRVEPSGRRRYLDAAWRRRDGRLVVVEIDGALHLLPRRWWADQMRQNELALADALVLRYPTVLLREEEHTVVAQLRRALLLA